MLSATVAFPCGTTGAVVANGGSACDGVPVV